MTIDWDSFTRETPEIAEVRLLGCVDVTALLALQKLMVHEVRLQSRISAAVMLFELPPTVTQGIDSNLLQMPEDSRELEARLIRVCPVRREGGAIMHQPGQLGVHVVVSLDEAGWTESEFRERIRTAIIRGCTDHQVIARSRENDLSVVDGRHGLLAQIAIRLEQGVTSFGFYLNVSCSLEEQRLVGRGLQGERISSLNAERVRPTQMPQVRSSLIHHLCDQLGYPDYHIHTGHPFLTRTRVQVHDKFTDR
ncbi:MAG: hypothetical protein JNL58_21035 [Planctomyces sp.]|nr:hypothetical protein [Planctomyces sp.]